MFALLASAVVAHLPNFQNNAVNNVRPEPSQAYYMDRTSDFLIDYEPGDLMLVQVLLPYRRGYLKQNTPQLQWTKFLMKNLHLRCIRTMQSVRMVQCFVRMFVGSYQN